MSPALFRAELLPVGLPARRLVALVSGLLVADGPLVSDPLGDTARRGRRPLRRLRLKPLVSASVPAIRPVGVRGVVLVGFGGPQFPRDAVRVEYRDELGVAGVADRGVLDTEFVETTRPVIERGAIGHGEGHVV